MFINEGNGKILIAVDDVLIAADLENQLKGLGYTVLEKATTGDRAIKLAERHQPDLVIIDIVLKGEIDSLDAAEIIRDKWGIPIIFLTGYADVDRFDQSKLTHSFGHLVKPVDTRDLKITTEMALYVAQIDRERKKTERVLRNVLDAVPHHIHAKDQHGRFIMANKAVANSYNMTPGEFVGKYHADIGMDELEVRQMLADDREVILSGRSKHIPEETCIDAAGRVHWLETTKFPFDNDGDPGVLVIAVDITERKKAEEALRESEEKYRLLADNINDNIWLLDLETLRFTYVSPSVVRITGFTAQEATGFELHHVLTPSSLEIVLKTLQDELSGDTENRDPGRSITLELEHYHKNNTTVWTEVTFQFIRDGSDRPTGLLGVTRNVSERRKLQEQLRQAQKMEAVGTLAGGIAHDFNNLLQAMTGYTQILLKDKNQDDPDYLKLVSLQKVNERAAQLVQQLLLFSRKVETERHPLDLNHEIDQIKLILERTIPKMVELEINLNSKLWAVKADPVQIEQILLNLANNAADAMPDGGKLTIETNNIKWDDNISGWRVSATAGNYVLLQVSDTGHGLDKETIEHIFEPFYTTKDIGKGTGLGLASVYGIVKSHDGYIDCLSEVGKGTTFKVYLPAYENPVIVEAEETDSPRPKEGIETVLLVDDEEEIRNIASEMIQEFGYTVIEASNGEQALEIYIDKSNEIDIIILDIGMPGMGGYKCLQKILEFDPSAKIIIASGYSLDGQLKAAIEAGAVGYVGKPYKMADLLKKVRAVLD